MNDKKDTKRAQIPRVLDVSVMLLWDDAESTDLQFEELGGFMHEAAPYARARRLQAALAEAQALGMPPQVLLAVLADWACIALWYRHDASLAAAVEAARAVAKRGPSPESLAIVAQYEQQFGSEINVEDPWQNPCVAALGGACGNFDKLCRDPITPDRGIRRSGWAWSYAMKMLVGLAEVAGDETVAALGECAKAMGRIYAWSATTSEVRS